MGQILTFTHHSLELRRPLAALQVAGDLLHVFTVNDEAATGLPLNSQGRSTRPCTPDAPQPQSRGAGPFPSGPPARSELAVASERAPLHVQGVRIPQSACLWDQGDAVSNRVMAACQPRDSSLLADNEPLMTCFPASPRPPSRARLPRLASTRGGRHKR